MLRKVKLKKQQQPLIEPRHEKTGFLHIYGKRKTQISFAVTAKLISAFVFATSIDSTIPLIPKYEISSC